MSADRSPALDETCGKYTLLKQLSSSRITEVFLARSGEGAAERFCALKRLIPEIRFWRPALSAVFAHEIEVTQLAQHPHVVKVVEAGNVEGEPFLALQYIRGCSLREIIVEERRHARCLPTQVALSIAYRVLGALSYIHRCTDMTGQHLGLVHCDVATQNVLISSRGVVKLTDFGRSFSNLGYPEVSDASVRKEWRPHSAPELMTTGTVDSRTDLYAVGALLFELLTGRSLHRFDESSDYQQLVGRALRGVHPLPSDVDPGLRRFDPLVIKALRPIPARRYQTAVEFRRDIRHVLEKECTAHTSDALGEIARQHLRLGKADAAQPEVPVKYVSVDPMQTV